LKPRDRLLRRGALVLGLLAFALAARIALAASGQGVLAGP
jgi:hypothetical protein